jgi:hypothetical protein
MCMAFRDGHAGAPTDTRGLYNQIVAQPPQNNAYYFDDYLDWMETLADRRDPLKSISIPGKKPWSLPPGYTGRLSVDIGGSSPTAANQGHRGFVTHD